MKAHGFRNYFTPLVGVLFTFPSRYLYAIGLMGVFSLAGWSRRIHAGFLVPRATQDTAHATLASDTGLSPPLAGLSRPFSPQAPRVKAVLLPRGGLATPPGLGCSPVARHYWGNHCCFLFLEVLRCFSSLRSPPRSVSGDDRPSDGRVVPFGDPRVNGHLHLSADYRSLSRPSSPP